MDNIHTYYDVLMVSRNASQDVIRAAFKSLCQKYHPDRNMHPDAERIFQQLNEAYSVLSNPVERSKYDKQLLNYEKEFNSNNYEENYKQFKNKTSLYSTELRNKITELTNKIKTFFEKAVELILRIGFLVVIGLLLFGIVDGYQSYYASENLTYAQEEVMDAAQELDEATPELDDYEDYPYISETAENLFDNNNELQQVSNIDSRTHAPNGEPYPDSAGYVTGYPQLNNDGASILTIDNSQNTGAIFGKLYYLDELQDSAVRYFYIPSGGGLNLRDISPGYYDVRYRDLENGHISKSESILIEEYEDYDGVRFSEITMTLYKVSNGNMQTYSIPESEF